MIGKQNSELSDLKIMNASAIDSMVGSNQVSSNLLFYNFNDFNQHSRSKHNQSLTEEHQNLPPKQEQ